MKRIADYHVCMNVFICLHVILSTWMGGVQQHRLAHGWIGRIEHTLTHGWIGWTHTHMDRLDGWAPTPT